MLAFETVEPKGNADACVIWLHGIGADGFDFVPVVPHLKLPDDLQVRFIFPHAPIRPVTCNGNYEMRAWYDILELSEIRKINENHLLDIVKQVETLIDAEINKGIAAERIILAGFSQGGAVAYHTALHFPHKLAGLIALSTYMGITRDIELGLSAINRRIPIRIAHGSLDDMVTERAARLAYNTLKNLGYEVQWKSYSMGHELCISEIRDIGRWIEEMLQNPDASLPLQ